MFSKQPNRSLRFIIILDEMASRNITSDFIAILITMTQWNS
jgi:hypothetical protein